MAVFLIRRLMLGLIALLVGLTASFGFWASQYPPLKGTPFFHAYWVWLRGVFTGGSLQHGLLPAPSPPGSFTLPTGHAPILSIVGSALGRTSLLLALTLVIVAVAAVVLGCLAAATRGSKLDFSLRTTSYIAWAVPGFVLATLLQQSLARTPLGWGLNWFPTGGWPGQCPNSLGDDPATGACPAAGHGVLLVAHVLYHLALPAVALAAGFIGLHARYLRNSLLEALAAPHIVVARGKGLPERTIVLRHAMRNALAVFVPALLGDFGAIFSAALVVDVIFGLGGIGTLFLGMLKLNVDGLVPIDTYQMQLILLFAGGVMIVASLLGEAAVALLDPRVGPS
jgi:peptide/nickel transport system permease protein